MKLLKTLLFALIILLLASCSTTGFNKRKYTKGRYVHKVSNYSKKAAEISDEQYAYNTNEEKSEKNSSQKNCATDSAETKKVKILKSRNIYISKSKKKQANKPLGKTLQKTTSKTTSFLKDNNPYINNNQLQSVDSSNDKGSTINSLSFVFFVCGLVGLIIAIIVMSITLSLEYFILALLLGAVSLISLLIALVLLIIWLATR